MLFWSFKTALINKVVEPTHQQMCFMCNILKPSFDFYLEERESILFSWDLSYKVHQTEFSKQGTISACPAGACLFFPY
jgi:hypothetical protein